MSNDWGPMPGNPEPGEYYRHFKGGVYRVVDVARDCEEPSRILVVYRNLKHNQTWVRDHADFWADAQPGIPRFEKITQLFTTIRDEGDECELVCCCGNTFVATAYEENTVYCAARKANCPRCPRCGATTALEPEP